MSLSGVSKRGKGGKGMSSLGETKRRREGAGGTREEEGCRCSSLEESGDTILYFFGTLDNR